MSDEKLDILSGEGAPIELITGKNSEAMMGLAERLERLISSNDPRAKRLKEFVEGGYSAKEIADKINGLLQKYNSIPDKGRNLLDVNQGSTDTEKVRIKEIVQESKNLFDVSNLMFDLMDTKYAEGIFSEDDKNLIKTLKNSTKDFLEFGNDLGLKKVNFDNLKNDYPFLTKSQEEEMKDIYVSIKEEPKVGEYFQLANQKFDTNKPEGNIFYKSDDGVIGFSTMASLQMHMLENHPELLKDKSIVEAYDRMNDKERFEFVKNLEVGGGSLLTRDEFQKELKENTNIFDGSIKNYNYDGLRIKSQEQADAAIDPPTEQGGPSLSKGYLQQGEYISDEYDPNGDESGYTGKAKKTAVTGKSFNPNDPTTYKWQYEVKGQRQNDGTLVPGTEDELYYVDAGEVDEDVYKKFKKPPPPTKQEVDTEKDKKIGKELGSVVTALKAGAGIIGLGKAMKDIPIGENQELSDSFKAYMQKSKELSESGLTAAEKSSIRNDLSNAYSLGAKNVLRASGGNRGTFLSNMGMLNTNRVNSLIKMGEIDAKMQRQNMESYGNMLTFQEKFKADQGAIGREMAYKESLRKSNLYGGLGSSLIGSAISDLTYSEQMKNMEPYMNEWARNMGLIKTSTDTESDAADDANVSVNTG
jgi:hypothetical protein|tara:strand:+ start:193 stop:2115 length:1923 start_codon:yes stop_codon:yes gene_type:complete